MSGSLSMEMQVLRFSAGDWSLVAGISLEGLIIPLARDPEPPWGILDRGEVWFDDFTPKLRALFAAEGFALVANGTRLDVRVVSLPDGECPGSATGESLTLLDRWLHQTWEDGPTAEEAAHAAMEIASLFFPCWKDFRTRIEVAAYYAEEGMTAIA